MAKVRIYGRFSFVHVHEAQAMTDQDTGKVSYRYNINVLIPKGDPQIKMLEGKRLDAAIEKFGDNPKTDAILAQLIAAEKSFLRDGDLKDWGGYEGHWYVSAANTVKPLVVDAARNELRADSGRPYGGAYGHIVVDVYAMKHPKGGHQVNASLKGVQHVKDGDAFASGPPASEDDFDDLSQTDAQTVEEAENFKASRELARQDRARGDAPRQVRGDTSDDVEAQFQQQRAAVAQARRGEDTRGTIPAQRQSMGNRAPAEEAPARRRLV